jgi:hypothetical protein
MLKALRSYLREHGLLGRLLGGQANRRESEREREYPEIHGMRVQKETVVEDADTVRLERANGK